MSELKCPFCQQKLEKRHAATTDYNSMFITYYCGNPECESTTDLMGCKEFWDILGYTRKELDIRKKQVEIANKAFDFIDTEWDNIDCSRKELGACAFNAKEDIAGWESDIETALEQKEEK